MIKKLNLNGISTQDRHLTIDMIQEVIEKQGGILLHHQMFSDVQISMMIEIKESNYLEFYAGLKEFIRISELDETKINRDSVKECILYLNISFSKSKGDLKNEIPAVPG
jgi:hypothetical protein